MHNEKKVRDCLEDMGNRNGIAGLRLEADGSTGLALKNGKHLYFRYLAGQNKLFFYSTLTLWQPRDGMEVIQQAMSMNCLESGTEGGVISWSMFQQALLLQASIAVDLVSVTRLEQEVELFINKLDAVKQRLCDVSMPTSALPGSFSNQTYA
ncbi:CesT family type III secretion system chaperone [Chitinivorax sp. B]|uniref:CesT family type III secretion system chaperone n=1 Tax=Chitinivorax sp. B TaxID=2502235 RepID=UPI0014854E6C|nr:CesT family type III secretion system chaperone [Chitinivorax sp. B]